MKLIAIFTAVIAVQTDEKCPEANRNVCVLLFQSGSFVLTYTTFRLSHEYTIFSKYTHTPVQVHDGARICIIILKKWRI